MSWLSDFFRWEGRLVNRVESHMPNWIPHDIAHYLSNALTPSLTGKGITDYYSKREAGDSRSGALHGTLGDLGATAALMFGGWAAAPYFAGSAGAGAAGASTATGSFAAGGTGISFEGGAASIASGTGGSLSLGTTLGPAASAGVAITSPTTWDTIQSYFNQADSGGSSGGQQQDERSRQIQQGLNIWDLVNPQAAEAQNMQKIAAAFAPAQQQKQQMGNLFNQR